MSAGNRGLIVGLLLAAGAAHRFGGDKLMARLADGHTVAEAACASLIAAVDQVIAVVPNTPGPLDECLRAAGAVTVRCAPGDAGMSASIARGIGASANATGWLIALGDMPLVPTAQHHLVAAALRGGAAIAAPIHSGRRGHPVGFAARFGPDLLTLAGDEGARALLARNRDVLVEITVDSADHWQDIDTPADLAAVCRRQRGG